MNKELVATILDEQRRTPEYRQRTVDESLVVLHGAYFERFLPAFPHYVERNVKSYARWQVKNKLRWLTEERGLVEDVDFATNFLDVLGEALVNVETGTKTDKLRVYFKDDREATLFTMFVEW